VRGWKTKKEEGKEWKRQKEERGMKINEVDGEKEEEEGIKKAEGRKKVNKIKNKNKY
jgi:hypothetical protein